MGNTRKWGALDERSEQQNGGAADVAPEGTASLARSPLIAAAPTAAADADGGGVPLAEQPSCRVGPKPTSRAA